MAERAVILATAGYDHTVRFWQAPTGVCQRTIPFAESQVNCIETTPDKQWLAVAGNPNIKLFECHTNNSAPVTTFNGHSNNITSVGFQREGKWMFSGSEDGSVKIWDLRAPGTLYSFSHALFELFESLHVFPIFLYSLILLLFSQSHLPTPSCCAYRLPARLPR